MSDYRRNYLAGGTYFFTLVAYNRRRILSTPLGCRCLHEAIATVKNELPFRLFAICLLPDHLHSVWILPPKDDDFSTRWKRIKAEFSHRWLERGGVEAEVTPAQRKEGRRGIWQPRFWEHTVVDEADLERCVDYLHWNPRSHRLVRRIRDWPSSSFHRFVQEGQYEINWGGTEPTSIATSNIDWGEP
jgi:putative transposase